MLGNPISPEDQRDFNRRLIAALEALDVTYAIGGSVAAMMYSAPRFTIDVDLMVSAPLSQLNQLIREVQSWQVYITPFEAIVETNLPYGLPFNIIDGTIYSEDREMEKHVRLYAASSID